MPRERRMRMQQNESIRMNDDDPVMETAQDMGEAAAEEQTEGSLAEELRRAEQKRDEYLDMAQRVQAEFDNYRRRTNAARSEAYQDGVCEMIGTFLPVIDNLERALLAEKEKSPLRDGVDLVRRQILELFEKRGVTVIDRLGEPFDPELEDAVMQADPSEGAPGTVCTVMQKGYRTQSRVIRHAMVRVAPGE